jgi:long-chain fatty acid transport protein
MPIRTTNGLKHFGISFLTCLMCSLAAPAQGLVLPSVGPVNRSMGGAAVAAPLDAIGATYWNPATITGLESSQMDFGIELIYPRSTLSSVVEAGALGPGIPPVTLAGSSRSDSGVSPLPTFGLVYKPCESDWTYGLGIFTIGAFGANYPGSISNPILTAQPPRGVGLGPVSSQLFVLQIAPTVAYQLTDHLSIGFSPNVDLASITLDPDVFASPDDANGDGFPTYPPATHSRMHWGAGFQVGAYYTWESWGFGASFKSPQWFETFRYQAADELGRPRNLKLRFDYPMIVSLGAAYSGFDRFLLALDIRYVNYRDTKGFGPAGFDATGAVTGVGWDSVVLVAAGVQYRLSEAVSLRMGYTFNTNPIPDAVTSFNAAAPTIYEHVLYAGASYQLTGALALSLSYFHVFGNSITGPIVGPRGPIPGTSVTSKAEADALTFGVTLRF